MPKGRPSRYQATKNATQTTQTTAAIGMVKEASVPMPADFLCCWMKPSAIAKYGLIGVTQLVTESATR